MLNSTSSPMRPEPSNSGGGGGGGGGGTGNGVGGNTGSASRRPTQESLSHLTARFAKLMETNPEQGSRMLDMVSRGLDLMTSNSSLVVISRSVPSWQRRPVLPHPTRVWNVSVTSATVRYSRVEYELRSELSSFTPSGTLLATGTSIVRRRFRDFVKLHDALARLPNVVVPALPPKSFVSVVSGRRADPMFVWGRRVGLQLWLRFVCDHHITRHTTALREFLWESETAAVSGAHFTDLSGLAESSLLATALRVQAEAALILYGTHVVALTAMTSRLGPLAKSYRDASRTAEECARLDARLGRGRARLSTELAHWADFEQGEAGQNFGFLLALAQLMSSLHSETPNASFVFAGGAPMVVDESMVSFSAEDAYERVGGVGGFEQPHTSTGAVDVPAMPGSGLDVRSLLAFARLVALWGDVAFPALAKLQIDPRLVRHDEASRKRAERGASEWTEAEGLRPLMMRDGAVRFVEDQLQRTRDELARWRELQDRLKSESLDFRGVLSSFEAIGSGMPSLDALDASRLSSSPSDKPAPEVSTQQLHHSAHETPNPRAANPSQLDADMDKYQELFRRQQESESEESFRLRYLNPFLRSDSSDEE